jgi:hypothetical protein
LSDIAVVIPPVTSATAEVGNTDTPRIGEAILFTFPLR